MTIGSTEAALLYVAPLSGSHCVGRTSLGQWNLAGLTILKVFAEVQSSSALGTFYHFTFPVPVSGSASGHYSAVAFTALATRCLSLALQIGFPCFSDLFLLCLRSLKSLHGNFVSGGFGVQTWVMCDNSSSCQLQQDDSSIAGNTGYFKKAWEKDILLFLEILALSRLFHKVGCTVGMSIHIQMVPARHSSHQAGTLPRCHINISGSLMANSVISLADWSTPTFTL